MSERPDKSVSRYDKRWQEYADYLEQKLERLTKRLEEIEAEAIELEDDSAGSVYREARGKRRMAQELLILCRPDVTPIPKKSTK